MNGFFIDKLYSPENILIICEIAQAHDGSLGMAHSFIDAVAKTGANAIKFQTHIASAESTKLEPWRIKFSYQDETRYDYWKRMEFTIEQWKGLKEHAEEKNLLFLSSPFSNQAVDLLEKIGIQAWKIASGEITNTPLIERMAQSKLPLIASSGMSRINEIDNLVDYFNRKKLHYAILQCTSMYPTPPEKIGLNVISLFQKKFNCASGISDHSGTIFPGIAAAVLGASIVEVHVTFSKDMFGPDTKASITFEELRILTEGIRFIEKSNSNPVDKDSIANDLSNLRFLFSKSIVAICDIPAGTILNWNQVGFKKPGNGIPPEKINVVIGKKTRKSLHKDDFIKLEDLE
jgi:N-acetylneuraminate synthase